MVAIMWLTGGKKPSVPAKATALTPPAQVPLEVNETKINELQNRIEELQREQLVAQSALAQQTRLIGSSPEDPQPQQAGVPGAGSDQKPEDPVQAERKRRAYVSLFASNVALTYRKTSPSAPTPEPESASAPTPSLAPVGTEAPEVARPMKEMQQGASQAAPAVLSPVSIPKEAPETNHDRKEEPKNPAAVAAGSLNAAAAKPYLLFEGTILETVL
ncbi:MAG: hypothetical protein WB985_09385, partial [Candidatus Acidiferrales bacterium]